MFLLDRLKEGIPSFDLSNNTELELRVRDS